LSSDPQLSSPQSAQAATFPVRHLLLLLAVGGILFFVALGRLPLLEPDEGRNAEVAREMLATGDLITPHFNTLVYLDKPIVYFWMVAASFRVAGVGEGAARLPSAVMALATMLLVWFLARKFSGNAAGLRAGLVFATAPLVIVYSRLVIFDMTLAFLLTVAMVSFWLALASDFKKPVFDVLLFAAMGLAAITKGPVGFLLPLLSILVFLGLSGKLRDLKRLRWGIGLAVFLAAALPWFVTVSLRHPDFPRYAFWQESLRRFATGSTKRGGNIFYYLPVYLAGFLPWSLFLLYAGLARLKQWRQLRDERNRPTVFLVSWVAVVFIFFTVSQSKLPGYFLPAIGPLSILMARAWGELEEAGRERSGWLRAGFWTMVALGMIAASAPQAFRLQSVAIAATEKTPPSVLALVIPSLFYSGVILIALGIVGRHAAARWTGRRRAWISLALLAVTVPLLLVRWRATISAYANASSSRQLAQAILKSPEKDLPIYGFYCFRTSLPFYLRRRVGLVTTDGSEMTSNYISANLARFRRETAAGAPGTGTGFEPLLMDGGDFRVRMMHGKRPFLVLARNRDVVKLSQHVYEMEPLWNDWEYSIWKIPPDQAQKAVPEIHEPKVE